MFWRWRKATWLLVIFDGLMLWWVIAALTGASSACRGQGADTAAACQAGATIGTGIGVTLVLGLWFMGFIVCSLIWMMSRPAKRMCPQCGRTVRKGITVCRSCHYDFAATAPTPVVGA